MLLTIVVLKHPGQLCSYASAEKYRHSYLKGVPADEAGAGFLGPCFLIVAPLGAILDIFLLFILPYPRNFNASCICLRAPCIYAFTNQKAIFFCSSRAVMVPVGATVPLLKMYELK